MSQVLIAITLFFSSLSVFLFNNQISQVSTILNNIPIKIIYSSVVQNEKDDLFYFNKIELEPVVVEYFYRNLKYANLSRGSLVIFTYYDSNHNYTDSSYVSEVQISLRKKLMFNFDYLDSISYTVTDTYIYE